MTYISFYDSPLGKITLASGGSELSGLWFQGQKYYAATVSSEVKEEELPIFSEAKSWLDIYFSGLEPGFTPPLSIEVSPFRKRIYELLLSIPYGKTLSYGKIAAIIAEERGIEKMSPQAVGSAVGRNPISLIIPCHRVLGTDGSLKGYAGGTDRKLWLLNHEKIYINKNP